MAHLKNLKKKCSDLARFYINKNKGLGPFFIWWFQIFFIPLHKLKKNELQLQQRWQWKNRSKR